MQSSLSAFRIFVYQYSTLGVYFLVWCHSLGASLTKTLRRKAVPSLWWFILPGGAYYWIWRMAESLESATGRKVKRTDTFLLYILLSLSPYTGLYYFDVTPTSEEPMGSQAVINFFIAMFVVSVFLYTTFHAIYITIVQRKIDHARGNIAVK